MVVIASVCVVGSEKERELQPTVCEHATINKEMLQSMKMHPCLQLGQPWKELTQMVAEMVATQHAPAGSMNMHWGLLWVCYIQVSFCWLSDFHQYSRTWT